MDKASTEYDLEDLVLRYLESPRSDLRDLIVSQSAGLVERAARRFSGIEPIGDLSQVGYIGLLNALSKFNPTAGVKFFTYANYLVAGEIKHYLRDRTHTIRQPAWRQELRQKISKTQQALQASLARVPTSREIAEVVGVSENCVNDLIAADDLFHVGSLDSGVRSEDQGSQAEAMESVAYCPEELSVEDRVLLEDALGSLRDLERQVMVMFHLEGLGQTEIATALDISNAYVSHVLRQSLGKLRKILTSEEQKDRLLRRKDEFVQVEVFDQDTGVYNEEYFRNRLAEEVHRTVSDQNGALAILILEFEGLEDLARFYGVESVQDFLVDAAYFLKDSLRRLDIVARFGQTGLAAILPFTGASVSVVKDRLLKAVVIWAKSRQVPSTHIRFHVGTSWSPENGRSAAELISAASAVSLEQAA